MFKTVFTDRQIAEAKEFAEDYKANHAAEKDSNTKDPENWMENKVASHLSEQAFIRAATSAGRTVNWHSFKEEGQPAFDVLVGETKVDVKCSTNEPNKCNLIPGRRMLKDGREVDAFALVRIHGDFQRATVFGVVTVEQFKEESHDFFPLDELRMMNDELNPVEQL